MFRRKKTVFVVVVFDGNVCIDYPKRLPLPEQNDFVGLDDYGGTVKQVRHITNGDVTEIKIICWDENDGSDLPIIPREKPSPDF